MGRFKKDKKNPEKVIFSAYWILLAEKHFFLNLNRWRYEILIKSKKFRLDVTISKKQKNPKKVIFSAYRKLLAKKWVEDMTLLMAF